MGVPKDNGPVSGMTGDPGKGTLTIPANNGDLIQDYGKTSESVGGFTFLNSDVRGADGDLRDAGSKTGLYINTTLGADLGPDAVNAAGSITGSTGSDAMFEKFNREDRGGADATHMTGSESPESVTSTALYEGRAGSDPMFQDTPDEQALGDGAPRSTSDKD